MMAVLTAFLVLLAGAVVTEMVKREYMSWAPALARCLVRVAGRIHRARAEEWMADILYLQSGSAPSTGLWEAFCHICGAPKLAALGLLAALANLRWWRSGARVRGTPWYEREHFSMAVAAGVIAVTSMVNVWAEARHSVMHRALLAVFAAASFLVLVGITARGANALRRRSQRHR